MKKLVLVVGALLLATSVSNSALAGWGKGSPKNEHPQADPVPNSDSDFGAPGGHGGGGFGTSDRTNGTNGDVSGVNGNQGSDNANPRANNAENGNAGTSGGGEP